MKRDIELLQGNCGCMLNNKMLYVTEKNGTFVQVDLSNGEVEVLGRDALKSKVTYIAVIDDAIYAVDANGAWLAESKIEGGKIIYHDLECDGKRFVSICRYKGKIFFFLRDETAVMVFDALSKRTERYTFTVPYSSDGSIFDVGCFCRDSMFLFNLVQKVCVRYSLSSYQVDSIKNITLADSISSITYANGKIYALAANTVYEMTDDFTPVVTVQDKSLCTRLCVTEKHIWMMPGLGEDIFIYSMETGQYRTFDEYPNDYEYSIKEGWWKFMSWCGDNKYIYWLMRLNNYILKIDRESGQGSWIKPFIKNPSLAVKQYLDKRQLVSEGICSLEQYLTYIGLEEE